MVFQKYTNSFDKIPVFWLTVDATNTPHYEIGQFLGKLLNPLAQNEYTLKDSFEAVDKIHKILVELFDEGYRYFSFDEIKLVRWNEETLF